MLLWKKQQHTFFYAGNEPKSVLARDLGDCRDNLRNSQSVFLIVSRENFSLRQQPYGFPVPS